MLERITPWIQIQTESLSDTELHTVMLHPAHPDFEEGIALGGMVFDDHFSAFKLAHAYEEFFAQMESDWHEDNQSDPDFNSRLKKWVSRYVTYEGGKEINYLRITPDFLDFNQSNLKHGVSIGVSNDWDSDKSPEFKSFKYKIEGFFSKIEDLIFKSEVRISTQLD